MWADGFELITSRNDPLSYAVLHREILLDFPVHERASVVMSVRAITTSLLRQHRLIFMLPPPTEGLPALIIAGLLMSHLLSSSSKNLSYGGVKGDILLVTHAVNKSIDILRNLSLSDISLRNVWSVESYSRYTPIIGEKPRVFVANAGGIFDGLPTRKLGAIVIDATHPRIQTKLTDLFNLARDIDIQIAVTPPVLQGELVKVGYPDKAQAWIWDPEAESVISEAIEKKKRKESFIGDRSLLVCEHVGANTVLVELHDLLYECQRSGKTAFPPLWEVWSLYHRLRQLAVPLALLDDSSYESRRILPIKKRIDRLRNEWPSDKWLQIQWPKLVDTLERLYNFFLQYQEPPKFLALADRIACWLEEGGPSKLRVVLPTEREGAIFSILFGQLEKSWLEAQRCGKVEIVTIREEARLVAAGELKPTLLLGFRAGAQRYLDLYPRYSTEVICYPFEVDIDRSIQNRDYSFIEELQIEPYREQVLKKLNLYHVGGVNGQKSLRPVSQIIGSVNPNLRIAPVPLLEPAILDLHRLASRGFPTSWDEEAEPVSSELNQNSKKEKVQVRFEDGREAFYSPWQSVFVYFPLQEKVRRYEAKDLQPMMRTITLVGAVYENIYAHLIDAIKSYVSPHNSIVLELWNQAKAIILNKHNGNRKELFSKLQQQGLQVNYEALTNYFRDSDLDERTLAPQHYSDVKVLARYSGLFTTEETIQLVFGIIQQERQRRRDAGRALHSLLRAIVTGEGYEKALDSARQIGSDLGEVLASVEVRTIQDVCISRELSGLLKGRNTNNVG